MLRKSIKIIQIPTLTTDSPAWYTCSFEINTNFWVKIGLKCSLRGPKTNFFFLGGPPQTPLYASATHRSPPNEKSCMKPCIININLHNDSIPCEVVADDRGGLIVVESLESAFECLCWRMRCVRGWIHTNKEDVIPLNLVLVFAHLLWEAGFTDSFDFILHFLFVCAICRRALCMYSEKCCSRLRRKHVQETVQCHACRTYIVSPGKDADKGIVLIPRK